MKVCDVHTDRKAVDEIILSIEDSRFDVCQECRDKIHGVLTEKPDHKSGLLEKVFGKS